MHVLVINNSSIHINEIHKLFPINAYCTYISYRQVGWYDMRPFDCIILTWSSTHTYAYKAFAQEMNIIEHTDKPIIWICLWCELIVSTYWWIISKQSTRIEWDLEIICKDDAKTHLVHEAHKYCITNLWDELEWLWQSTHWYEIIKHKTKPILWFQFHPEVSHPSNDWLNLFMKYFSLLWIWKISLF